MSHPSTPQFQTFHALRIKGFATVETLAEITELGVDSTQAHLDELVADGLAQFREARSLWQLTPDGRTAHPERLDADLAGVDVAATLGPSYEAFLALNSDFKELCGDWQLRNGEINDHSDADYDAQVLQRLSALNERAQPIVSDIGAAFDRFLPYAGRLAAVVTRVLAGESNMFTGVMCGSYHDAWMELHEDLILSQGIDRAAEGSF